LEDLGIRREEEVKKAIYESGVNAVNEMVSSGTVGPARCIVYLMSRTIGSTISI